MRLLAFRKRLNVIIIVKETKYDAPQGVSKSDI